MFRYLLSAVVLLNSSAIAADKFEFEDRGFRLRARDGATVEESGGFKVSGEDKGISEAKETALVNSARQDARYNGAVNRLGEAGHGVAYPLYRPVYTPVPVAVPVPIYPAVAPHCTVSRARYLVPHCSASRANLIAPHCTVSRAHMMFGPYPY